MSISKLKVIGLISGGKDSIFSLLHCLANGHEVVALANLFPVATLGEQDETEDVDSYMYQTIGHRLIPLYAQALGLPLYREPIRGGAANMNRDYSPTPLGEEDETESLMPLLRRIKQAHPDVNAISTGAILSTYQRTRVESVATRMGLIPLSFLWQFPYLPPYRQASLLEDMHDIGQISIIVKVASGGLTEDFLGKDVAAPTTISKLQHNMSRFGHQEVGNILGEGGEFETLALGGPQSLWKGKIVIEDARVLQQESGTAIMKIGKGHVVPTQSKHSFMELEKLRMPDLLDAEFHTILNELWRSRQYGAKDIFETDPNSHVIADSSRFNYNTEPAINECTGQLIRISNIHCAHDNFSVAQQMQYVVDSLRTLLQRKWSLNPSIITFSSLILRRMSDFDIVNEIYGSLFEKPNPPARVTITCGSLLPQGVDVVLSVAIEGYQTARRRGLHVQSRSYWAPANIGPYSQAIAVPVQLEASKSPEELSKHSEMVYVAGQIPLIPRTMNLLSAWDGLSFDLDDKQSPDFGFHAQSILSLQHLWRIGRSMGISCWVGVVAFIAHCEEAKEAAKKAAIAILAWHKIHQHFWNEFKSENTKSGEEVETKDVWDSRNNRMLGQLTSFDDNDTRQSLPNFSSIHTSASSELTIPPCYVVEIQELPRGSDIEWWSAGFIADKIEQKSVFESTTTLGYSRILSHGAASISYLGFHKASSIAECTEHLMTWIPPYSPTGAKATNLFTVYITANATEVPWSYVDQLKAELVPCWRIWSYLNTELEALVVIHTRQLFPSRPTPRKPT